MLQKLLRYVKESICLSCLEIVSELKDMREEVKDLMEHMKDTVDRKNDGKILKFDSSTMNIISAKRF